MARYTGAPMWLSPQLADQLELGLPGPHSQADLRAAWRMLGAQIMAEPHEPGVRPLGFWLFTAGRSEHLLPKPPFTGDAKQIAEARDDYAIEPILFLAEHGYLRDGRTRRAAGTGARSPGPDWHRPAAGRTADHRVGRTGLAGWRPDHRRDR